MLYGQPWSSTWLEIHYLFTQPDLMIVNYLCCYRDSETKNTSAISHTNSFVLMRRVKCVTPGDMTAVIPNSGHDHTDYLCVSVWASIIQHYSLFALSFVTSTGIFTTGLWHLWPLEALNLRATRCCLKEKSLAICFFIRFCPKKNSLRQNILN